MSYICLRVHAKNIYILVCIGCKIYKYIDIYDFHPITFIVTTN